MEKKNLVQKIKNIPGRIEREIEKNKYKKNKYGNILQIRNFEESIKYIKDNKVSFYRYGDAEIAVMRGMDVPFQKADPKLAQRLLELLNLEENGIEAAIPYYYLNSCFFLYIYFGIALTHAESSATTCHLAKQQA